MLMRRALALMLGLMLLTTTVATAAAGPAITHDEGEKSDKLELAVDHPRPFARLSIGKGSELVFYVMLANGDDKERGDYHGEQEPLKTADPDGRRDIVRGVGMMRYIPAGGMDPATVPELRDANPHEIFYALSTRGTDIPRVLSEFHPNSFARKPQGWALRQIKPEIYKLFTCENTEQIVSDAVAATGLPYSYNELSEGPHNGPFWSVQDPNQLFPTFYKNNGLATVGDAYFHVMLCEEDPNFVNTGVHVRLSYEETDGPYGYGEVIGKGELHWALHNPGDQMSFMSWPFDSDMSGDNNWSWMLTVSDVHYNDTLHIGTAWS